MIIACPECAGPFELPDDQIAALVQIACPHCTFRMILDFAAANDPSLIEHGMRMASGFRSAADYRATGARPRLEPVAAPEPAAAPPPRPAAAPAAGVPQVMDAPDDEVGSRRRPAAARPAARAVPTSAPAPAPRPAAQPKPPARTGATVVGPMPGPPGDVAGGDPAAPIRHSTQVGMPSPTGRVHPDVGDVEEDAPTQIRNVPPKQHPSAVEQPLARPQVQAQAPHEQPTRVDTRPPPHSPSVAPAHSAAAAAHAGAAVDAYDDEEYQRPSRVGAVVLVVLLLIAGGLVGASLALKGTPDPRPLLEQLFRG